MVIITSTASASIQASSSEWIPTPTSTTSSEHDRATDIEIKKYLYALIAPLILGVIALLICRLKRTRMQPRNSLQHNERGIHLHTLPPVFEPMPLAFEPSSPVSPVSLAFPVPPVRREEGLNEDGEAPPPYAPPTAVAQERGNQPSRNELAVPPPQPPGYTLRPA